MRIEDEIKQTKPFKSELQKLILNISFTSNWLNAHLAERLKSFDITPHQFNVLRILKGKHPEGYCNQDITCRMLDRSSNATRIVDKLIDKKLVNRTENSTDRRQVDIKINSKGLKLLEEIEVKFSDDKFLREGFNEEKARLMNEWLDELRDLG